jgi:hypothetical protein
MQTLLFGWPYGGLGLAVLLVAWLLLERRAAGAPARLSDPAWVMRLLWPMYLVHQFEEHGVDLFGHRYAFLAGLCQTLGYGNKPGCPADPAFIFAVNAVGCQITFVMPWLLQRRAPLVAACAWGVALVNAVVHLGGAAVHGAYNPGVLTSLVLFLPLSAWMLHVAIRSGTIERRHVWRVVASGAFTHAVLLLSLNLRTRGLSHEGLLVINALNGLCPLAFGLLGYTPTAPRVSPIDAAQPVAAGTPKPPAFKE